MVVHSGRSSYVDAIRDRLKEYKEIKIIDVPDYDINIFNQREATNRVLLTTEAWTNIHPSLVTIPVKWEFTTPYGLLYGLNPSKTVKDFICSIEHIM